MTTPQKEYIPAGSYVIESAKDRLLIALLGSSVGVALVDRQAAVGGLLHILLPEPTDSSTTRPPESYASTGLPHFIENLEKAGADKSRLQASISGGSLFSPKTDLNLDFDAGGLSTEIVLQILRTERISIERSEINGFFGSRLSLNTSTWQADIQPIIPKTHTKAAAFKKPGGEEINSAIGHIRPIPQIALKLMRIIRSGDYNMSDLAAEIRHDQVIGAKVLRFCNSPIIGLRKKIDSIDRAITLLGENRMLEVVISAAVDPFFDQQEGGYSMMRGGLYQHALGVANIAKILSQSTGKSNPESAYTAGLLHDIGKVVLDQYITRSLPLFYQSVSSRDQDFVSLEQEFIGIDHQEVGRQLGIKWNLPENLTEAIALHHNPEDAVVDRDLAHIVYVADLLSSRFQAGLEYERITANGLVNRLEHLGLNLSQLPELISRIPWENLVFT
jgi:putative nucleotidyltransferase with HDIG domain